jgi:hypothetical protein
MEGAEERKDARWLMAVVPIAAVVAVAVFWGWTSNTPEIGPLDRAQVGGLVGVPLTVAVPVLAAWVAARIGGPARPILAAIVAIAGGLAVAFPFWAQYAGQCAAVQLAIPAGPIAIVGAIAGVTLFLSTIAAGAALAQDRSPPIRLGLAVGATAVVFIVGFAAFALVGIGLFFGQCVVRP